jgi:ribosomal protein S18 acetylase RimI-like enzyme
METVDEATYYLADGEGILVRPIRESDLPAMEWDGEYTHFRQLYADHFAASRLGTTLIYIAETLEGKMIGQVFIQLYSRNSDVADGRHRAYLFSFRIKPEYRSQGIGSFMLQFVEDQLLLRGFDSIRLNVARANVRARKLYERLDYRVIGSDPGLWRYQDHLGEWHTVHEPAWKMLKKLR